MLKVKKKKVRNCVYVTYGKKIEVKMRKKVDKNKVIKRRRK